MKISKPLKLDLFYIGVLFLYLSLLLFACKATPPKLMSYKVLSNTYQRIPDVLNLSNQNIQLKYFGTYHSFNPEDSIFIMIKREFESFHPDFVLHEGGDNWPMYSTLDSTVRVSGDPGCIRFLAQKADIPFQSLEPKEREEYNHLLQMFEKEKVVLMYFCRQIHQQQLRAQNRLVTDEQLAQNIHNFLSGLKYNGISLNDQELQFDYWKKYYHAFFGEELDWRQFNPANYYPNVYDTKINEINRASGNFRNHHMVNTIFEVLQQYDKVMVLVGGSHLVIQRDLLKYRFERL